jgi:pimeloyl-ACP methyl ester carboxylesterase
MGRSAQCPRVHQVTPHPALRAAAGIVAVVAVLSAAPGCTTRYVSIREVPDSPLVERLQLASRSGPKASPRTRLLVRRLGLEPQLEGDQSDLLTSLQKAISAEPTADKVYAFAELAYLEGKRLEHRDPAAALDLFGASVVQSYAYLFDRRFGPQLNPYDPQFRGACDLYNGALEDALRIARQRDILVPGKTHTIDSCSQNCLVTVVCRGDWQPDDFERFEFVSEYSIEGVRNRHRTFGLGVPLIAVRKTHPERASQEKFYPPGVTFPVTAFLRVMPDAPGAPVGAPHRALLELHDPLVSGDLMVGGLRIPLESDLTTPLAYFLNQGTLSPLATMGLLRPDDSQKLRGLYMAERYDPRKAPVILVHGLWSDPTTWTEMYNELRSYPELRDQCQFWFYFYPSGQPFWISAAQFRGDLAMMRDTLDPERRVAALDQIVLVGHSMGGLVSKLQTLDSGDDFWRTASRAAFPEIKAPTDVREGLARIFYFQPNPSVRRVITLGTPHSGSEFANSTTRYFGNKLIALPRLWVDGQQALFRENPDAFASDSAVRVNTSIDSLAPDSPFLPVMLSKRRPPAVRHHNIVGVVELPPGGPVPPDGTDGVVTYRSAHLEDADSELAVAADHLGVHRHPLAVLEVRRILLEHLAEMRANPPVRQQFQFASPPESSGAANFSVLPASASGPAGP